MTVHRLPTQGDRVLLITTAWHEAGHALAALREGQQIVHVRIHYDNPGNGDMRYVPRWPETRFRPSRSIGNARAAWVEEVDNHLARLRILLAGPLAEARKLGKPMRALGGWYDFEDTYWLAQDLMGIQHSLARRGLYFRAGENVPALFNAESRRIRTWLARPVIWSAISRIATELLEKGRLGPREVLRCYLQARSSEQMPLDLDWSESADPAEARSDQRLAA